MATIEQIIEGLVAFRDETYSRLDAISEKLDNFKMTRYRTCGRCQGGGKILPSYDLEQSPPELIDCPVCNGLGNEQIGVSIEGV